MPELPEVETTRKGIERLALGQALLSMTVRERRLRWPISNALPQAIANTTLAKCERRGKYLLLGFDPAGTLLVHLGMSGSIRAVPANALWLTHDHVQWVFSGGICLRYNDPRRFGSIMWHPTEAGDAQSHPLLSKLGIEPFDSAFDPDYLLAGLRGKKMSIKQLLLAGHVVVGVGNIYASESLFRARIHPAQPAADVTRAQAIRLVAAIVQTLTDALASGGSTLRDYVDATGEPGAYFELYAAVYEKNGQPCRVCDTKIKRIVQGQRATYFCPRCQRPRRSTAKLKRSAPCLD
jgi:formamidopyrimidine-DNA glycosylase